ncbi:MAG: dihydropteroate synthase [Desulfobacterales bacterium]|nr:dihydropteroate synthase [Desulfobacterales bacterium]
MANHVFELTWGDHCLVLGRRACVMGVVNITPDSFSDGGRFFDTRAAVNHGLALVAAGANIVDIGGESTRPFSDPVAAEEEIRRVVPVIEALAPRIPVPISIDTTKADVARRALAAGAAMINDVSALRVDPAMGPLAAAADVPVILMHMLGTPKTMQVKPDYQDVVDEVRRFLADAIERAMSHGIARSRIVVDPGIGFGKTFDHNLLLIRRLDAFEDLGVPLLVGASRKAFIRNLLKPEDAKDIPADLPAVASGSLAAAVAAVLNGAHIVRVHDVAAARAALTVVDAIRHAS